SGMVMEKPCRLARMSLIFIGLSKVWLAELWEKPLTLSTIDNDEKWSSPMVVQTSVTAELMPGFQFRRFKTAGAEIHAAIGGDGPPLLLMHGNPLTLVSWHRVAPKLAERYTVVATDLRG